ncbi:MAG: helix-turn-helix transcriptional regulator [Clostridia bacterium]|nr:helix-turn-helix transcriptional regulator [Clostridia bacterium]
MDIYRVDSEYLRNYDKVMVYRCSVINEDYSTTRYKNKEIYVQRFNSDFFNLVYTFENAVAVCNNIKISIPGKSVIAVNRLVDFNMYPADDAAGDVIGIMFKPELYGVLTTKKTTLFQMLEAVAGVSKITEPKCPDIYVLRDESASLEGFFTEAEKEWRERKPKYIEIVKSIITSVIINISRDMKLYSDKNIVSDIVQRIVDYCELHYCEKLEISHIEKRFNYSGAYITKLFKNEVGMTFAEYVRQKKIILASRKLERTNEKICDIARDVGFNDRNHFCECFKKYMGVSPSVYRTEVRRAKPWFVGMGDIKSQREISKQ